MKKLAFLGAIAAGLMSTSASAATIISFDIDPLAPSGTYQSGFGVANQVSCDAGPVGCSGAFTASGTFLVPVGYNVVGATVTSGPRTDAANDIDFLTGFLNGQAFTFLPNGVVEFGSAGPVSSQALNTLTFSGLTGGQGTFSGTLTFAAVPEASTWLMMILGFLGVGVALRRRRVETPVRMRIA